MSRPRLQTPDHYSNTLPIKNQFNVIAVTPDIPYSQIARAPAPITPTKPIASNSTTQKHEPTVGYFTKPQCHNVTLTNFKKAPDIKTLKSIISRYFSEGCQWYTDNTQKTQTFYEFILVDSGSIELVHTPDPKDPSRISFSKCIIKRVFKSDEWLAPFSEKGFSKPFIPKGYNYPDYKQAWFRTFFLRPFDHSWFFTFHTDFIKHMFPIWFLEWWMDFGPVPDIHPPIIQEAYSYYISKNLIDGISKAPIDTHLKPIRFYAEFKVPWILCWNFAFDQFFQAPFPISIIREFKVKWWQNYSTQFCNIQVIKNFLLTGNKPKWEKQISTSSSTEKKNKKSSKDDLPQSSSLTQQQIKMFQLLEEDPEMAKDYLQFIKMKKTNSDKEGSSSASSSSDPYGGPCAQDPFDL